MSTDNREPSTARASTEGSKDPEQPLAASAEAGAESQESPTEPLNEALAEVARIKDQLLRTAADFDNFRKRTRREIDDAQKRGREELLRELLPVFDNLERAAQHAGQASDAKAVADGVAMVLKQFSDTLGRAGIKRVVTVGAPFDPTQHEAIQQIETAEHPAGTVVAEVQPGYQMGDRLVRAAMVVVAKPPPSSDRPSRPEPN
jgi:molecular chaperone GrpE